MDILKFGICHYSKLTRTCTLVKMLMQVNLLKNCKLKFLRLSIYFRKCEINCRSVAEYRLINRKTYSEMKPINIQSIT